MGRSAPAVAAGVLLALASAALPLARAADPAPPPPPPPPSAALPPAAAAQPLVEAAIAACRTALVQRYAAAPEQVDVWLAPGLSIAIEDGSLPLVALRRDGLQLGWMVRGKPAPVPIGLCRSDGSGAVRAIEEQKD
jgi:hypothetical protein